MSYQEEDYLQLSGIQHFAYCPRQWALIHIEQAWADNAKTARGNLFHKNADRPDFMEKRGQRVIRRSVRVFSSTLGISGICDVVEYEIVDGTTEPVCRFPVEYKVGKNKPGLEDRVQLCAEAMCLEEMHEISIPYAYLYYGQERRRTRVDLDDELRLTTTIMSEQMHDYFKKGHTPTATQGPKCRNCSLADLCMPPKNDYPDVRQYIDDIIFGRI